MKDRILKWLNDHNAGKLLLCAGLVVLSSYFYAKRPDLNQSLPTPWGPILVSALLWWLSIVAFAYYFFRGAVVFALNTKRVSQGAPPITQAALDGESQPSPQAPAEGKEEGKPETQEGPQVVDNRPKEDAPK